MEKEEEESTEEEDADVQVSRNNSNGPPRPLMQNFNKFSSIIIKSINASSV